MEVVGAGNFPDQAVIAAWITDGVRSGQIVIEPTSETGTGAGERSILSVLANDPFYGTVATRVVSNNKSDFPTSPTLRVDSTQQYLVESLFNGGSSIAEYMVDSARIAMPDINGGPPLITPGMVVNGPLVGLPNGVVVEFMSDASLRITDASGVVHRFGPFDRFDVDANGQVELVGRFIPDQFCFPAGTPIATPAGVMPVEDVRPGDLVLAFDASVENGRGALVPARVVRLFANETTEWLRLTWDGGSLTVTPGHRVLDADGLFRQIDAILEGARPRIVLANGAAVEVTAERIVWSEANAHAYEAALPLARAAGDGLAARLRDAIAGIDPAAVAERAAELRRTREVEERQAVQEAAREREPTHRERSHEIEAEDHAERDRDDDGLSHGL